MPSASAPGMPITDSPIETTTAIVVIVTSCPSSQRRNVSPRSSNNAAARGTARLRHRAQETVAIDLRLRCDQNAEQHHDEDVADRAEQSREDLQALVEHGRRSRRDRAGIGQVRRCRRRVVGGSQCPERRGSWCRRRGGRENPSRWRSATSRSRSGRGLLGNRGAVEHEESSKRRDEDDAHDREPQGIAPPTRRFNRSLSALRNTPNRIPANSRNSVEAAYQTSASNAAKATIAQPPAAICRHRAGGSVVSGVVMVTPGGKGWIKGGSRVDRAGLAVQKPDWRRTGQVKLELVNNERHSQNHCDRDNATSENAAPADQPPPAADRVRDPAAAPRP